MYSDVYNTTINVNGNRMFSSSFYPGYSCGCCGRGMFGMNSCFGFGYGGMEAGIGMGLGFAAGMALVPALPNIFKGIGKGLSWFGSKVIAPAATFAWNSVLKPAAQFTWNKLLKPAGKAVWSGIKWTGNTIAKGAKAVAKGVSNLWNKIFHKKSKVKA